MSTLKDVFFISMEGQQNFEINGLQIRDDIMLPLFVEEGSAVTPDKITPENIMTGMVKVIMAEPDNENLDYYRQFIYAVDPNIEGRLSSIAYEAENNNHYEDAFEMFKTLIALNPTSIDTNLNLAVSYDEYAQRLAANGQDAESDKYEEMAYEIYKEIDKYEEKNEAALFYLGRFYLLRENYNKSIEYFKEFVNISSDEQRVNEVKKLLTDMEHLGIKDDDYNMGITLINSEKYTDAVEFFDKFIAKFPHSWNGYYMKAIAQRYCGDHINAIANLESAGGLNPGSSDIFNEMGLNFMAMKKFKESELSFSKALRNNPDDASIISNLAMLNYRKGDKAAAKKYLEVILELYPDDLHAKDLMKVFEDDLPL